VGLSTLKPYLPIILEDLKILLASKVDLVEAFLRYYDLLHFATEEIENDLERDKKLAK